jgi:hypothetical protein
MSAICFRLIGSSAPRRRIPLDLLFDFSRETNESRNGMMGYRVFVP